MYFMQGDIMIIVGLVSIENENPYVCCWNVFLSSFFLLSFCDGAAAMVRENVVL